ncbi:MAG: thioredoxin family protein [Paracoccaceae bacterium]
MLKKLIFALALLASPLAAAELGDDGLHKPDWLQNTFRDMAEDLAEATDSGLRLLVIWEQRGCIYCTRMHENIFPDPEIDAYIRAHYFVVQMNLFGDVEVTDFDGEVLSEKQMARKWGVVFTPTMMFFPEEAGDEPANMAAVLTMPGAFERGTVLDMLTWIVEHGYENEEEHFQHYSARMVAQRRAASGN